MAIGVGAVLYFAYPKPHQYPALFFIPMIVIFVFGGLVCWIEYVLRWAHGIKTFGGNVIARMSTADEDDEPAEEAPKVADYDLPVKVSRWVDRRDKPLKKMIIILGLVEVAAVARLVAATGGGVKSPFAPLLTAIAIFGPSLARRPWSVWAAVAPVCLAFAIVVQFHSKAPEPNHWWYAGVAIGLVFLAGMIQWLSLRSQKRR
jgi:hypothetical protein